MLAISSPQEQKQILGKTLFPLVKRRNPDQSKQHIAGKIQILQMIENQDDLLKEVKAAPF